MVDIEHLIHEALRVQARTPYSERELTIALRPFLTWAVDIAGLEPDLKLLMTRRVIELFTLASKGGISDASRGNFRSRLLRVSEALAGGRGGIRLSALPAAQAPAPYSSGDVAALLSWAATRATPEGRRNAEVLLALGLGGGLTASEIGELRESDVCVDADGICLDVHGTRERDVILVRSWATRLRGHLHGGADYVFRPGRTKSWPNVITSFVGPVGPDTRPQTQRMRATWIVRHLEAGTNVVALMRASGVESLEAFTRFVQYVRPPEISVAREMLRQEAS